MANLITVTARSEGYTPATGSRVVPVKEILEIAAVSRNPRTGAAETLTRLLVGRSRSRATELYVAETPAAIATAANA